MNTRTNEFYSLPYAGNQNDLGVCDEFGNILCVYFDGTTKWYFVRDDSWDNVDFAGVDLSDAEVSRLLVK